MMEDSSKKEGFKKDTDFGGWWVCHSHDCGDIFIYVNLQNYVTLIHVVCCV